MCSCNGRKLVRYTGDDDWSALYVDGKLEVAGDHYNIEDAISDIVGVEEIHSEDFLQGGNSYDDVAKSLDEIHAYQEKRRKIEDEAERAAALKRLEELRAEEASLIARLDS